MIAGQPVGDVVERAEERVATGTRRPTSRAAATAGATSVGSTSSRSLVFVSIRSVCGNQYVSTWWCAGDPLVEAVEASSQPIGVSLASSTKSGSTRNVIVVSTPSAPRPSRANSRISGFSVSVARDDLAGAGDQLQPADLGGQRRPRRRRCRGCRSRWRRRASARRCRPCCAGSGPAPASSALRTLSWVPASAVTVIASRSTDEDPAEPGRAGAWCARARRSR